jgi:hypothetical protein
MKDGKKFNLVVVSTSYSHLPEEGEAIRVSEDGSVLAMFIDGNLIDTVKRIQPNNDDTLPPAA